MGNLPTQAIKFCVNYNVEPCYKWKPRQDERTKIFRSRQQPQSARLLGPSQPSIAEWFIGWIEGHLGVGSFPSRIDLMPGFSMRLPGFSYSYCSGNEAVDLFLFKKSYVVHIKRHLTAKNTLNSDDSRHVICYKNLLRSVYAETTGQHRCR